MLSQLDDGIHDADQYNRKLSQTWIYAKLGKEDTPKVCYVATCDHRSALLQSDGREFNLPLNQIDVVKFRPDAGLVNLKVRPVLVSHRFTRQWHIGTCHETVEMRTMGGEPVALAPANVESAFNPIYPTFQEALAMLEKDEKRHIAINSQFSIRKGKNRMVLLYMFRPVASFSAGFSFIEDGGAVAAMCCPDVTEWRQRYEDYWRVSRKQA